MNQVTEDALNHFAGALWDEGLAVVQMTITGTDNGENHIYLSDFGPIKINNSNE